MSDQRVAVIGAGPAGMSAAVAAGESGAQVTLIDEQETVGGQLRWRVAAIDGLDSRFSARSAPELADELKRQLEKERARIDVRAGTAAWGLFADQTLGLADQSGASELKADAFVIATGSTDMLFEPFPGWTLPGVMTSRAAQIFLHVHRVAPGKRWAVIGDGAEADEIVSDLKLLGLDFVARCSPIQSPRALGTAKVEALEIDSVPIDVDIIVVAHGRQPDPELAFQARVDNRFEYELGGFVPFRDRLLQTSSSGIYVAGDAAGICTVPQAMAEGRLAGLAAAGANNVDLEAARSMLEQTWSDGRRAINDSLTLTAPEPAG